MGLAGAVQCLSKTLHGWGVWMGRLSHMSLCLSTFVVSVVIRKAGTCVAYVIASPFYTFIYDTSYFSWRCVFWREILLVLCMLVVSLVLFMEVVFQ